MKSADPQQLRHITNKIAQLERSSGISFETLLQRIAQEHEAHNALPISIFSNSTLACLESIVKYLHEERGLSYTSIARLLGRNTIPIGITYRNAKRKMPGRLDTSAAITPEESISVRIFRNTTLSVLESIVTHLKANGKTLHEIATILKRDDRTIWTAHARAQRKIRNTRHTHNAQNTQLPQVGP